MDYSPSQCENEGKIVPPLKALFLDLFDLYTFLIITLPPKDPKDNKTKENPKEATGYLRKEQSQTQEQIDIN